MVVHAFASQKLQVRFKWQHYLIACVVLGLIMPRQTYVEHYLFITLSIIVIPSAVFFQSYKYTNHWFSWLPLLAGFSYQAILLSLYFEGNWMG